MMNIKKIVLPVDFPDPSLGVVRQAATLAHHFHSEIVVLHVVDVLAATVGWSQEKLNQSLGPELEGLTIRHLLVKGDPAKIIVQRAAVEKADLIMMPSHGYTFNPVSSWLRDSESTPLDRMPGLDQCPRGRISGAGVRHPQRSVCGRFQPPYSQNCVVGRANGQ
jgi:nucleotide-binding universal stress UspA family protein